MVHYYASAKDCNPLIFDIYGLFDEKVHKELLAGNEKTVNNILTYYLHGGPFDEPNKSTYVSPIG